MNKRLCLILTLILSLILPTCAGLVYAEVSTQKNELSTLDKKANTAFYASIFSDYTEGQYIKQKIDPVIIKPGNYEKNNEINPTQTINQIDGSQTGLYLDDTTSMISWEFSIENPGLYYIELTYQQKAGSYIPITRAFTIDKKILFDEMNRVAFPRFYKDEGFPIINHLGDEVRPASKEIEKITNYPLTDNQGKYNEPFFFYLDKGVHSIQMAYIEQPMILFGISVIPAKKLMNYQEIVSESKIEIPKNPGLDDIYFEAEDYNHILYKTDSSIAIGSDSDPKTSPQAITSVKMNMIGSYTWRKGNQNITWSFNIKSPGYYKIAMRAKQAYNNGLMSCRQIKIDDIVPFKELSAYYFPFSREFYTKTLESDSGDDFLFYLLPGDHTISFTAKMGDFTTIYHDMNTAVEKLNILTRRITLITGSVPDVNYDYRLDETIPNLLDQLDNVMQIVSGCINQVQELSDGKSTVTNKVVLIQNQIHEMLKNPGVISRRLSELNQAVMSLGDSMSSITEQPLAIDYFQILPPENDPLVKHSNFFDKVIGMAQSFFISFTKDYDAIGSISGAAQPQKILDVWVSRGKEWGELLKELSDSKYTPDSKTAIKIKILPSGTLTSSANPLLLAINSGKSPDLALSIPSNLPVEYAIRNAVVDLTKFKDYSEIKKRFIDAISIPFEYQSGVYALPETMNMRVLFYRKDILDDLNIKVPETWDDVYQNVFPALYKNKMQMYIPPFFDLFLAQNIGRYYTNDGMKSALDEKSAFLAFDQMVKLYTNYGVPFSANFFNRMRSGEMPIGIDGYAFYMQIAFAAPELNGKWGIAPIPGVLESDGSINRKTGGIVGEADVILSQSKQTNEAWDFLKWWTSNATQIEYGSQLEARIGSTARWNSSNQESFRTMPWPKEHLAVIEQNWENTVEQKIVLGGYFTSRHISNALNRCVVSNQSPRDSLEEAVEQINIELKRKQESKGVFIDKETGTKEINK